MANSLPPPLDQPVKIDGESTDTALSLSSHITHQELMARRFRRLKQLAKIYRNHHWALMEELKFKYREYYWKYGRSPFKLDGENGGIELREDSKLEIVRKCRVNGCKDTAMALTKFCHLHILLDSEQKLYKACTFVVKSSQGRNVLCGKPTLRSTVPSLCYSHFQKAETYVARALKKAGSNVSSPSKIAPKLHIVIGEFVHHIQAKRRAAQRKVLIKSR